MKISNSKKQLAKIIHENGCWRDWANFAAQDKDGEVFGFGEKPVLGASREVWAPAGNTGLLCTGSTIRGWHQTILSRDEYFHLYPVADTAPEPVAEAKPTIEQMAADYRNRKDYADRKQQEADAAKAEAEAKRAELLAAKADAEAKLAELVAAGKALGLVLGVAGVGSEPELVITDWRDLQVGDEVRCAEGTWASGFTGQIGVVVEVEDPSYSGCMPLRVEVDGESDWGDDFDFIRRPAKEAASA